MTNIEPKQKALVALAACVVFGICFFYGAVRLQHASSEAYPNIQVRLVQASIPQEEKWQTEKMWGHFLKQIDMSAPESGGDSDPDHTTYIVWPETAVSHKLIEDENAMRLITDTLGLYRGPAYLITGLLRFDREKNIYFNSLVMFDKDGAMSNVYDKHHLVPFGEYIPFQKWMPWKSLSNFAGFETGNGPGTFQTPEGIRYSPVVCYEIIFPRRLTGADRPDFILTVTNDAWYGISAGPRQHFTQAIFRAVEEGIPVVRVASTGISGIIDPHGRVISASGLFENYARTFTLPRKLPRGPLPSYLQTLFLLGFLAVCIMAGYIQKDRKQRL